MASTSWDLIECKLHTGFHKLNLKKKDEKYMVNFYIDNILNDDIWDSLG